MEQGIILFESLYRLSVEQTCLERKNFSSLFVWRLSLCSQALDLCIVKDFRLCKALLNFASSESLRSAAFSGDNKKDVPILLSIAGLASKAV